MYVLENYDIAFSRDPADPAASEVALFVVEHQDLPPLEGEPHRATLLSGEESLSMTGLRRLRVDFVGKLVPRDSSKNSAQIVVDLPLAIYEMLTNFNKLWICEVDQGRVVSEYELSLYKEMLH